MKMILEYLLILCILFFAQINYSFLLFVYYAVEDDVCANVSSLSDKR